MKSAHPEQSELKKQRSLFSNAELVRIGIPEVIEHTHVSWAFAFEQAAKELAEAGKTFTSEDLTDLVGMPPGSSGRVGGSMQALVKRLKLRSHGRANGRHPRTHGAKLEVWGK